MGRIEPAVRAFPLLFLCLRAAAAAPEPVSLLFLALEDPTAYEGQVMIARWFGRQTRAEEVSVHHGSSRRYRWEFLRHDGRPGRVVISDGSREELRLSPRTTLDGLAPKSLEKRMGHDWEKDLLLKNYRLAVLGEEPVVGRKTWVLELLPRSSEKPRQKLWIDQETGVILQNRRFRPGGAISALSRFTRFEPKESLPDSLFSLQGSSAGAVDAHGLDPDFFSLEQLSKALGKPVSFPPELPEGFAFESADLFSIGDRPVRHIRYTDGLAMVSLFDTDRPIRFDGPAADSSSSSSLPGAMHLSTAGRITYWKEGKRYFTLVGDVSENLFSRIAAKLKR